MKYFTDKYKNRKDLISAYKQKSKELHPDNGGSSKEFIEMKREYESILPTISTDSIVPVGELDHLSITNKNAVKFNYYKLSPDWRKFLGKLPKEKIIKGQIEPAYFYIMIWGGSGAGKTAFSMKMASEFSRLGNVLYINSEEDGETNTFLEKAKVFGMRAKNKRNFNIFRTDTGKIDRVEELYHKIKPDFIFTDSVHDMATKNRMKVDDLLIWKRENFKANFIDLFFTRKDALSYKGASDIRHIFGASIKCRKETEGNKELMIASWDGEKDLSHDKNRYQNSNSISEMVFYHKYFKNKQKESRVWLRA